jgi:hypothetical protein
MNPDPPLDLPNFTFEGYFPTTPWLSEATNPVDPTTPVTAELERD